RLYYYVSDTLSWIPIHGSAIREFPSQQLEIDSEGAHIAKRVFSAWAELVGAGPERLTLRGLWCYDPSTTKGDYEKLVFERDQLVGSLKKIAVFFGAATTGESRVFISDWTDYNS